MKKIVVLAALVVGLIDAHGMMMDPINRSSAWRQNFTNPVNYDDNELYCGGVSVQYVQNKGECGVCGDDYSLPRPRPNENGGFYGNGLLVKRYVKNSEIEVTINLTTNHWGTFELSICPLINPTDLETDECFANYPVLLSSDHSRVYHISNGDDGPVTYKVNLPRGLTCKHCVMRWHWRVANTWGKCENGTEAVGCGSQETFRSCSDISIVESLPNGQIFEVPPESPKVQEPKVPVIVSTTVQVTTQKPTTPAQKVHDDDINHADPLWAIKKAKNTNSIDFGDPLWAVKLQRQQQAARQNVF